MYIIAKLENGKLVASVNPYTHATPQQASKEATVLAQKHPGTEFIVFKATRKVAVKLIEEVIE